MFEVIGVIVVCWVAFKVIKGILRGVSTVRSQEYGKEARHIATRELKVPEPYYNYLTVNKIEAIKNSALLMRENGHGVKHCSWPRLLALTIYGEFHQDCEQWQFGNPIREQLFMRLGITPDMIASELERDPLEVMFGSI